MLPRICALLLSISWLLCWCAHAQPADRPRHVLVIGYDGLSPKGLESAKTPVITALRQRGSWTMHARGVMPTSSSPNWASMIMGAGPEQHGVTSNDWMPDKFEIAPVVRGRNTAGIFPTMFGVLREQEPSARIGIFHEWDGFARLVEPGVANTVQHGADADETVRRAIEYLRENKPRLTFIHLDLVDHAGHEFGHGTPEYIASIEKADGLTGLVLDAVQRAGMMPGTLILLTADHGGVGKKHGSPTMAEIEIPWILAGPGVAKGREVLTPVNTYDTAATIAYAVGLRAPVAWLGKPVLEAFGTDVSGTSRKK